MEKESRQARLSLVVAVAGNGAIGKGNDLLWHIPADLKHFKALTTGHVIIMGRKTYESFPKRPLPDRYHIVLSRGNPETLLPDLLASASSAPEASHPEAARQLKVVANVESALAAIPEGREAFVIGGGQVYRQFLPYCSRAYVTEVKGNFEADTFFPVLEPSQWRLEEEGDWQKDAKSGLEFRFKLYQRCGNAL